MDEQPNDSIQSKSIFDRLESEYANNVAFESTVWDLKLIFGEYSDRLKGTEWHTSITIPWAQAKLILYYLKVNVEAYEADHGKIHIPPGVYPPSASSIPPDPNNPGLDNLRAIIDSNLKEFLKSVK